MKKITLLAALFLSVASFAQIASTSFEEPAVFTVQYIDTGDPNVAHPLADNPDEPFVNWTSSGGEMGFAARYEPYDTPGDGLTDGDFVGVTDFAATVVEYTDGLQGYQISDADGNFILEFDTVDLSGTSAPGLSMDYFVTETGYEGDGTVNESGSDRLRIYVKDLTNATEIDILDTTGSDINDLGIEGAWRLGTASLLPDTTVQLVIEARMNAGAEAFYFDNIVFEAVLGVNDEDNNRFAMFPNPANDIVNISSTESGTKTVAVFDVLGKLVVNAELGGDTLDISNLNSGVYIVKITQGTATTTKKLVVR